MKQILGSLIGFAATLLAVFVGYHLGEKSRRKSNQERIASLKNMINKELETILGQIPQKKDIVQQIIKELKARSYIPGTCVGIANTGYKEHIPELYQHLTVRRKKKEEGGRS